MSVTILVLVIASARASDLKSDTAPCRTLPEDSARLRCYDQALKAGAPQAPPQAPAQAGSSRAVGGWRLVRTPNPQGGPEAVSIMHPADPLRSSAEFVGLMLRCGAADFEVLPVVIPPLPPRAQPKVTIGSGAELMAVDGRVTPPGAAILLPAEVGAAARARWGALTAVEVAITAEGTDIHGAVQLDDFAAALAALAAACPAR